MWQDVIVAGAICTGKEFDISSIQYVDRLGLGSLQRETKSILPTKPDVIR